MADYNKPLPTPDPVTQPFWDSLKEHALKLQKCGGCKQFIFYPRPICPSCMSDDLAWTAVSGEGWSTPSRSRTATRIRAFGSAAPFVVALIELEEGARIMSQSGGGRSDAGSGHGGDGRRDRLRRRDGRRDASEVPPGVETTSPPSPLRGATIGCSDIISDAERGRTGGVWVARWSRWRGRGILIRSAARGGLHAGLASSGRTVRLASRDGGGRF